MARWACLLFFVLNAHGAEAPLRILFLGNSYTYFNHLAGLVEGMARRPVETQFVAVGGATLEALYTGSNALEVLRGSQWDLVVLQEQSTLGLSTFNGDFVINVPSGFHTWARIWDREIRAAGAHTVFLNTWARKGRAEQQPHLDWAYAAIARELRAGLIPAGAAFQEVNGIDLYQPDGHHPSAAGSYLAACAAVEILTGDGCAGASAEIRGLPMDNASGTLGKGEWIVQLEPPVAAQLRRAAMAAVSRLRAEGGYWKLTRPAYGGEESIYRGRSGVSWNGRWEGTTWVYGKKADITLELSESGGRCTGTWRVSATEPPTQTNIPVDNCVVKGAELRFTVRPLFMVAEVHEAAMDGTLLTGHVRLISSSAYHRNNGTWTLRRVTP
ncbi:MAG: SGNH/GDSL hydrolase family protein [Acidobacteria bacterium]|nr:SGNH/GDSL hydrolase family protein [Acidobacteriota bacterium]